MFQYVRAIFRNVTKDRAKQWVPVQEYNYVSVFSNNFKINCHVPFKITPIILIYYAWCCLAPDFKHLVPSCMLGKISTLSKAKKLLSLISTLLFCHNSRSTLPYIGGLEQTNRRLSKAILIQKAGPLSTHTAHETWTKSVRETFRQGL